MGNEANGPIARLLHAMARQPHVQAFLEGIYHATRLHSSLDQVSPDEFEAH